MGVAKCAFFTNKSNTAVTLLFLQQAHYLFLVFDNSAQRKRANGPEKQDYYDDAHGCVIPTAMGHYVIEEIKCPHGKS